MKYIFNGKFKFFKAIFFRRIDLQSISSSQLFYEKGNNVKFSRRKKTYLGCLLWKQMYNKGAGEKIKGATKKGENS